MISMKGASGTPATQQCYGHRVFLSKIPWQLGWHPDFHAFLLRKTLWPDHGEVPQMNSQA